MSIILFGVAADRKLTGWGCGGIHGLVNAEIPRLADYSIGPRVAANANLTSCTSHQGRDNTAIVLNVAAGFRSYSNGQKKLAWVVK
jgi:hypothetical protein